MKRVFVDKRARERMDAAIKPEPEPQPEASAETKPGLMAAPPPATAEASGNERDKLIQEAMSLYRQRRADYEKLDGNVRRKIDKAARDAFGAPDE